MNADITELRKDPITGRWAIIYVDGQRELPKWEPVGADGDTENCPFCEGHEDRTSPEIFCYRKKGTYPNTPGWFVRCIPHIHPWLSVRADLDRKGLGLFDMMHSIGAHEVIIETPHHDCDYHNSSIEQVERILSTYRDRIVDLKKDQRLKYVLIFKNRGKPAGSLHVSHAHSQVIATPVVPIRTKQELHGTLKYFKMKDRCIFCDMIRQELKDGVRVVDQNETFLCLIPYASRFPYECLILPKRHRAQFSQIEDAELKGLAQLFKRIFNRLHQVLNDPPYNCVLHDAPNTVPQKGAWQTIDQDYHWHFEIIPRIMRTAGFEWGSGFHINPIAPEKAVEDLRSVSLKIDETMC
jgi:UDPglucose--hexose-1-phosphate uridylyltransferase